MLRKTEEDDATGKTVNDAATRDPLIAERFPLHCVGTELGKCKQTTRAVSCIVGDLSRRRQRYLLAASG